VVRLTVGGKHRGKIGLLGRRFDRNWIAFGADGHGDLVIKANGPKSEKYTDDFGKKQVGSCSNRRAQIVAFTPPKRRKSVFGASGMTVFGAAKWETPEKPGNSWQIPGETT
jgi:hypothetical protein